jgi:hypothetical protein
VTIIRRLHVSGSTGLANDVCGLPPGVIDQPFTLSFKEPRPIPVERYPLYCEPAGLRICQ